MIEIELENNYILLPIGHTIIVNRVASFPNKPFLKMRWLDNSIENVILVENYESKDALDKDYELIISKLKTANGL